jgi:hypothetical protein
MNAVTRLREKSRQFYANPRERASTLTDAAYVWCSDKVNRIRPKSIAGGLRCSAEARQMMTRRSIEALLDLVEIKISAMQVMDREDARELATLEACKRELTQLQLLARAARARQSAPPASVAA